MDPAKNQWECESKGQHSTPGQAGMHHPSLDASLGDKSLEEKIVGKQRTERRSVSRYQPRTLHESLQATLEVHLRGRTLSPNGVPVDDGEGGKEAAHGIGGQGPIEVLQAARANIDHGGYSESGHTSVTECSSVEVRHVPQLA